MSTPRLGPAWLVFGAALALRAGWVLYEWHAQTSVCVPPAAEALLHYDDERLHWQLARNLVAHGWLITDDGRLAARMPLYPLFLAPFAVLGPVAGVLAARLAQAVVGGVTAALAFRLADSACGRRTAWIAGVLVACDPFGVFFTNLLLTEALFTPLAVGLTACAWGFVARPSWGPLAGVALLGPALILTRPSAAGWVPLVWLLLVWLARGRTVAEERRLLRWFWVCPIALAVLMLPWGLRNHDALDSFAWLSTNGGATLYDAQGPQADGRSNQRFMQELPELRGLDEVALDQTLKRLAVEQMKREPARVLRLAGVKFLRTWSLFPHVAEWSSSYAAFAGAAYTLVVLVGAIAGLWLCLASRPPCSTDARASESVRGTRALHALLWLPVLYFTLVHCIYIGSVRYRVPLMPFLSVAAASGWTGRRNVPQKGSV